MKRRHLLFASLLGLFAPDAKAQIPGMTPPKPGEPQDGMQRGEFETRRNTSHNKLFEAMLHETYGDITNIGVGHHVMLWREGASTPSEFPSADCVIFDHTIAKRIWGDGWKEALQRLAVEPAESRDRLLGEMYRERHT